MITLIREVREADVDALWPQWNIYNDRHPHASCDDMQGPEYDKWVVEYITVRMNEAYAAISSRMIGNQLPVYRVITAPEDWTPEIQHPGIYWSWDKSAAAAHSGQFHLGHIEWMMEAFVGIDDVDWYSTWFMNVMDIGDEEKEIRLKTNVPVKVEKYYRHR